jgi:hypothetical protein
MFEDFEIEAEFPIIGRQTLRLSARQIKPVNRQPALILLAMEVVRPAG